MSNPFMVTSNECYGMSLREASKRAPYLSPVDNDKGCGGLPGATAEEKSSTSSPSQDLSFLYSRESDRIGQGTSFSDSSLSRVFRLKESDSMSKRRKNSVFVKKQIGPTTLTSKTVPKEEVKDILSQYKHNPKNQNPLYGTSANEIGLKKPSSATYPTERHGMSQKFSQSFNRTMFRDEGLNSSMTKSNIHDLLTPQFV
mmetsp:Transcript_24295/g.43524  ORF Transcript_24295/g.43524 Transcript_24295/m.43524 type:complete len:199 (+) Transcript_24295:29-625(+)